MKFWPIADVILVFTEYPYKKAPAWVFLGCGLIGITALWSTDPVAPLFFSLRFYLLWSAVSRSESKKAIISVTALGLIVNLFGMNWSETSVEGHRRSFQYDNPELLSLAGMVLGLGTGGGIIGALAIGVSGSRAAVLFLFGVGLLRRSPGVVLVSLYAAVVLFLFRPGAFELSTLEEHAEIRREAMQGAGDQVAEGRGDYRIWKTAPYSLGFGYHSYNDRTGRQTPHNIYILILREMGVFATLVWMWGLYSLYYLRRYWATLLPLLGYLLLTDSIWYYPAGHYGLGLLLVVLLKGPGQVNSKSDGVNDDNGYQRS